MEGLSYEERLSVLALPTLKDRRDMIDMTQVYRLRNGVDQLGRSLFKTTSDCHNKATRSSTKGNLAMNKSKLDVRKHFFTNRVVKPWNGLPQEIKAAPSLSTFKSKLKNSYF